MRRIIFGLAILLFVAPTVQAYTPWTANGTAKTVQRPTWGTMVACRGAATTICMSANSNGDVTVFNSDGTIWFEGHAPTVINDQTGEVISGEDIIDHLDNFEDLLFSF